MKWAWLLLVILFTACSGTGTAWRVTSAVRSAGTMADQSIAIAVNAAAEKCQKAGETGDKLAPCVRKSGAWKAQVDWRKYGVPAVNSAIVATVAGLQIAEKVGEKANWISLLMPAACALARAVRLWGEFLGASKNTILIAARAVGSLTCPREPLP